MPTNPYTQLNLVIHQHEHGTSTYVRDDTADDEDFDIEQFVSKHGIDFEEDREELILQTIDLPKHEVLLVSVQPHEDIALYLNRNLIVCADCQAGDDPSPVISIATAIASLFCVDIVDYSLTMNNPEWSWSDVTAALVDRKSVNESSQDDDSESMPSL